MNGFKPFAIVRALWMALWHALWLTYARAVLFLSTRGFHLPGERALRQGVASQTISAYERRALVYELKASRYDYGHGPLWLRALVDVLVSLWQKNRFWVALIAKGLFGALFVALPPASFLLLRGFLPVPERVPERPPTVTHALKTSLRVERPYSAPAHGLASFAAAFDTKGLLRGVEVKGGLADASAIHATFGSLPRRRESTRGFLVSESTPLSLVAKDGVRGAIEGRNRLRASVLAFPSASREVVTCRIELLDESGLSLVSSEFTPPAAPGAFASRLAALFQSRFTPDYAFEPVALREIFVDSDALPRRLTAKVTKVGPASQADAGNALVPPPMAEGGATPSHDCLAMLGEPTFEWQQV